MSFLNTYPGYFNPGQTVVIDAGQTDSGILDCGGMVLTSLTLPGLFTGAVVSFLTSDTSGGTFTPVYQSGNILVSLTVTAGRTYAIDPKNFQGFRYIKVRSGSTEANSRSIQCVLKGLGTPFNTLTAAPIVYFQQGDKIIGTGAVGGATQGSSVALSTDGNTLAFGGPLDNTNTGAVWIFNRTNGVWAQEGSKLVGTGVVGPNSPTFGGLVSLSGDGNTLAFSGSGDDSGLGAIWVFTRTAGVWSQQAKLVASPSAFTAASLALSEDGNTLATGSGNNGSGVGATYIFTRSGVTWTQQGSAITGTGNTGNSLQGNSVALSADGNTLAVGGVGDNSNAGATWVFTRSGTVWSQQGSKIVGTGATGTTSQQGTAVSLSSDGNTLISGAAQNISNNGSVWVFTRSAGTWTQLGLRLLGTLPGALAKQGSKTSINGDGTIFVESGFLDTPDGSFWIFRNPDTTAFVQQGQKYSGTGAVGTPLQAFSLAISRDGTTIASGGPFDNTNIGAVWVYTLP